MTVEKDDSGAALESGRESRQSLTFAGSAESMRPGDLLLHDESGRPVVGKGRYILALKTGLLPMIAIGAALGVLSAFIGISIWWFVLPLFLVIYFRGRTGRALVRVQSKLAAADLAGAEAALATAPQPTRGQLGALRARLEGYLAWGKGNIPLAIEHHERSLELYPKGLSGRVTRIILVEALARDGQVDRARELRTGVDAAGGSSLLALMLAQADLTLAIACGREADIDDATLHEWVKRALAHNTSKNVLILLARVLSARQDDELSDHCLRESQERFDWCSLEQTWPELHGWATARMQRGADPA